MLHVHYLIWLFQQAFSVSKWIFLHSLRHETLESESNGLIWVVGMILFLQKVRVGLKGIIVKLAKNLLHFVVLVLEK